MTCFSFSCYLEPSFFGNTFSCFHFFFREVSWRCNYSYNWRLMKVTIPWRDRNICRIYRLVEILWSIAFHSGCNTGAIITRGERGSMEPISYGSDLSSEIQIVMVFFVLLLTGAAWSIQFGGQYDSLLHGEIIINCQKLIQALTLRQCEFGFFSRSIETLLKAVAKGKRKRTQVDIKYFSNPFYPFSLKCNVIQQNWSVTIQAMKIKQGTKFWTVKKPMFS